jgi:hypothetical protein
VVKLATAALLTLGLGGSESDVTTPTVIPYFSRAEDGPGFVVECRNPTQVSLSSRDPSWGQKLRIDGQVLADPEGVVGSGQLHEVRPGETWRGLIVLRQSASSPTSSRGPAVVVKRYRQYPIEPGRHSFAVQCHGVWSQDSQFYWDGAEDVAR